MPRLAELLGELLRRVGVLQRDQRRQQLDDRHLAAEAVEDGGELAADDAAAEDDEPARHLGLREQAGRVHATRRVEPRNRRPQRERPRRDDRAAKRDVLRRPRPAIVFAAGEAAGALDPIDAVRLQQSGDAAGHLLDDGVLPGGRLREVELSGSETPTPSLANVSRASCNA